MDYWTMPTEMARQALVAASQCPMEPVRKKIPVAMQFILEPQVLDPVRATLLVYNIPIRRLAGNYVIAFAGSHCFAVSKCFLQSRYLELQLLRCYGVNAEKSGLWNSPPSI